MKRLLVLGAGTAGTMAVNKLRPRLPRTEWKITVVDAADTHYYQPGYLFIPFGMYRPDEVTKPTKRFIPTGVDLVTGEIDRVVPDENKVLLADGTQLDYDYLIIATGTTPRPDETPGMADGEWRQSVHEFYTYEGAVALAEKLKTWQGGRLVVHIVEMPIKCPVAPLEFTFLADAYFTEQGMRDQVEHHLRHPAGGRLHQARLQQVPRRHARRAQGSPRGRLHARAHRPGHQDPRLVRRAGDSVRPARHGAGQHGRGLRRPVGSGRRAELRPGRQAHAAVQGLRQHLRARRRQ